MISTLFAKDQVDYLTAIPKEGDGIMSLLRRYHILDSKCDVSLFYELNNLKKNSALKSGKKYKLPIYLYEYNSVSIRSTIGDNNWDKAVRIRDWNLLLQDEKTKPTDFRSGIKELWVPHHELYCDEIIEIKLENTEEGKKRIFPIFGKKHQSTPLKSNKLKGQVYYIVSGHGGPDPGAIGTYGKYKLCEDEYAYDISLRLCKKLLEHGAVAYMITRDENDGIRSGEILPCDNDEVTWKDQKMFVKQKPRLLQRSNAVNKLYELHRLSGAKHQTMICIHIDSRSVSQRADVFFYYHPSSSKGRIAAKKIHSTFKDKYAIHRKGGKYSGTVTARDLHMLRETKPTSIYVELGNIRNPSDQKRFVLESNREVLAKWLFEGMTNFAP